MRNYLGKTLKKDVVNAFGVTVLPAYIVLQEEHLLLLEKHKIEEISVVLELLEPPLGVLSTMIGKWLHLQDDELTALTLAATLHDAGKSKIPADILNKPGKLAEAEFEIVKKHTVYGYEMLKKTEGISHRAALVALQHHEREDGRGYPLGLTSDRIDLFSKIVAVADMFHAMSSDRPYHKALPFYEVVRQLREGYFGQLDPHIVSVFLENITTRMIGQRVVLTDDRVSEEFVDLSCEGKLQIKQMIGQ